MKRMLMLGALGLVMISLSRPASADMDGLDGRGAREDIWAPWRRNSMLVTAAYQADPDAPRVLPLIEESAAESFSFPDTDAVLPFTVDVSDCTFSETTGVEITLSFRVGRIPPARLEASHGLARFVLKGPGLPRGFWLHAYSRGSAFCLNGIVSGGPRQEVLLARGAANPQSGPRLDTQWHTVKLAWSRGQMAASWDGLPVLHVTDPEIDFTRLTLEWVKPGPAFGTLEMKPIEVRAAQFGKKGS